ncbi:MAG: hypothetical protein MJZ99_09655 [Bacteroidales bacterium]|nr:hypothetical protein [Bacteroidales bacterium]
MRSFNLRYVDVNASNQTVVVFDPQEGKVVKIRTDCGGVRCYECRRTAGC